MNVPNSSSRLPQKIDLCVEWLANEYKYVRIISSVRKEKKKYNGMLRKSIHHNLFFIVYLISLIFTARKTLAES